LREEEEEEEEEEVPKAEEWSPYEPRRNQSRRRRQ